MARQLRQLQAYALARGWQEAAGVLARHINVWVGDDWRVVTLAKAERDQLRIVRCSRCDSPAVILDSFHPYHQELTLCFEHSDAEGIRL